MPEQKDFPLHTKSIDDRTVTTLFSVAGNVDYASDRLVNGAFTKTFRERGSKILHLWNHDLKLPPIAVIKSVREVSRAELPADVQAAHPDATGGAEAISEYLDTPHANSILAGIKAGAPLQASFAYDVLQSGFTNEDRGTAKARVRNITEVKVFEISTCNLGCNDASLASKTLATPSASTLRRALQQIKAMDGMEVFSEAYDIYGAAAALSSIGMLLEGESDDPQAMTQLIGAMRLLLAFIGGEIDGIETGATSSPDAGMQTASRVFAAGAMLIKAGARNANRDQSAIDTIHQLAYDLGATNCLGIPATTSGDKSRADPPAGASLTLLRQKLAYLDFASKE